jgi:hypothetical protein
MSWLGEISPYIYTLLMSCSLVLAGIDPTSVLHHAILVQMKEYTKYAALIKSGQSRTILLGGSRAILNTQDSQEIPHANMLKGLPDFRTLIMFSSFIMISRSSSP